MAAAARVLGWLIALSVVAPACREREPTDERAKPSVTQAPPAQPAPSAPPAETRMEPLVVVAGGDVNLGRGCGQKILADPGYDPFAALAPLLGAADIAFANLESQLFDNRGETQSPDNLLIFCGPPGAAPVLARAGFDVVSTANNHAWDYGKQALFDTMTHLERAGVAYVGTSHEPRAQYEPVVLRRKGFSVALFAVTQIWNQGPLESHPAREYVANAEVAELVPRIESARREHDIVLVSYHGGSEYIDMPVQRTREFVRTVMSAGADAVLGHHPHVPHGVGWHEGRPAFYSLGNLVFSMHRDYKWTGMSFIARLTFASDGDRKRPRIERVEACPYHIVGHRPMLFEGAVGAARRNAFRRHLAHISVTVGGSRIREPNEDGCLPLEPPDPPQARLVSGSAQRPR
jgi:poly-gamma-glutamate capsule biosynthesis protein CapA/YwtB (metallophosphatase superfamily)